MVDENSITNTSRTAPLLPHTNLTHDTWDIHTDNSPEIKQIDILIYNLGSIHLKPISRPKLDDFKNQFEINAIGAEKL